MLRTTANILKICFYAVVILAGVVFAVSNRGKVDLIFYPVPYILTMPLFLFAIAVFTLGLFIGWSLSRLKTGSHRRAHKQAAKRVAALENELGSVRAERLIKPAPVSLLQK